MSRVAVFAAGIDWRRQIAERHVSKSTAMRLLQDGYRAVGHKAIQKLTQPELLARRAAEHLYQLRCTAILPPLELPGIRFVAPPAKC